ncbi:MAG: hypothetical protein RIQ93_2487 [Verrucomicrobiota bacterium]|jgi:hypothetical protein
MRTIDLPSRETIAAYLHAAPPAPASPGPARNAARPYPKHPEFAGLHGVEYDNAYQAWRRKQPGRKEQHTAYNRKWRLALRVKEEAV